MLVGPRRGAERPATTSPRPWCATRRSPRTPQAAGTTVAAITRGSEVTTEVLVGDADQRAFAQGMAFALAFLFYLSSIAFGMTLAGSVVEEKQSRIVEIIATKIPVRQLLAGKVLGNTGARRRADGAVRGDRPGRAELHRRSASCCRRSPARSAGSSCSSSSASCSSPASGPWRVRSPAAPRTSSRRRPRSPCCCWRSSSGRPSSTARRRWWCRTSRRPRALLMPQRILEGTVQWWEPVVALGDPARGGGRGGARGRAALPALAAADPGPDLAASGVVRARVSGPVRGPGLTGHPGV